MKKLIAVPAIALAAGISLAACGSNSNSYNPVPAPPVSTSISPAPKPAAPPTISSGQTATFNQENTLQTIGTTNSFYPVNSLTVTVGKVVTAPYVVMANQGLDNNAPGDGQPATFDPTQPHKIYPAGGSNPGDLALAGSGTFSNNPDYQFTVVYVTIKDNGPVGQPNNDPTTGKPHGYYLGEENLGWVVASNGTASDLTGQENASGSGVAQYLGVNTNVDMFTSTNPNNPGQPVEIAPGATLAGAYTLTTPSGAGYIVFRDYLGNVELRISVP